MLYNLTKIFNDTRVAGRQRSVTSIFESAATQRWFYIRSTQTKQTLENVIHNLGKPDLNDIVDKKKQQKIKKNNWILNIKWQEKCDPNFLIIAR